MLWQQDCCRWSPLFGYRGQRLLSEPTANHQRIVVGVSAHKVAEQDRGVFGAAFRQYLLAERLCGLLVENAVLLELGEHICIQHLGPFVSIVSRCIPSGKDMGKGCAGVGSLHFWQKLHHV